jgi:hypothetical protein
MTRLQQLEIERLVGDIAEEGTSPERIARLSELLRDNDELQLHYAKVMALHTMLAYELKLSVQQFAPLVAPPVIDDALSGCRSLSHEMSRDLEVRPRQMPSRAAVVLAISSVAAAIAIAFFSWPSPGVPDRLALSPDELKESSPREASSQEPPVVGSLSESHRELILTDQQNLLEFSRLTKTSQLSSMLLPVCSAKEYPSLAFCSGTVWMERSTGQKSRGYMLPVRPGSTIELLVDADASSQNALSVVEIDKYGRMTGSAIHFSNLGQETSSAPVNYTRIAGTLGKWSQRNDSPQTKYYLFTGTHSLITRKVSPGTTSQRELRYVSDYRVLLDLADLVYIGWDDSGYTSDSSDERRDDFADYDYNDIAALVRITGSAPTFRPNHVDFEPQPETAEGEKVDCDESCYQFVVDAQARAMLVVSTDAYLANSLDVVDAATNQVLWNVSCEQPGPGEQSRFVSEAFHIENGTSDSAVFYLRARHRQPGSTSGTRLWEANAHRELFRDEETMVVGFEDSREPTTIDWNDVQVQIKSIPLAH